MTETMDTATRRAGRLPHEIAMVNLLIFNLGLCGGILASTMLRHGSAMENYRLAFVLAPLSGSLALMGYSFWRWRTFKNTAAPWLLAHWQIACRHYRFLLIAYGVCASLIGLGWLLSLTNPNLKDVMFVALVRVAVAPLLIAIMVIAVLESSALFQANKGEAPGRI